MINRIYSHFIHVNRIGFGFERIQMEHIHASGPFVRRCKSAWCVYAVRALCYAEASLSAVASAPSFHAFKIQTYFFLFFSLSSLFLTGVYPLPALETSVETAHMHEFTLFCLLYLYCELYYEMRLDYMNRSILLRLL